MTHEQKTYRSLTYLSGVADALTDTHPKLADFLRATVSKLENDISDALAHAAGSAVADESLDEAEAAPNLPNPYVTRQEGQFLRIYDDLYPIATYAVNGSPEGYAVYCSDCEHYGIDPLPREGWGGTVADCEAAQ